MPNQGTEFKEITVTLYPAIDVSVKVAIDTNGASCTDDALIDGIGRWVDQNSTVEEICEMAGVSELSELDWTECYRASQITDEGLKPFTGETATLSEPIIKVSLIDGILPRLSKITLAQCPRDYYLIPIEIRSIMGDPLKLPKDIYEKYRQIWQSTRSQLVRAVESTGTAAFDQDSMDELRECLLTSACAGDYEKRIDA